MVSDPVYPITSVLGLEEFSIGVIGKLEDVLILLQDIDQTTNNVYSRLGATNVTLDAILADQVGEVTFLASSAATIAAIEEVEATLAVGFAAVTGAVAAQTAALIVDNKSNFDRLIANNLINTNTIIAAIPTSTGLDSIINLLTQISGSTSSLVNLLTLTNFDTAAIRRTLNDISIDVVTIRQKCSSIDFTTSLVLTAINGLSSDISAIKGNTLDTVLELMNVRSLLFSMSTTVSTIATLSSSILSGINSTLAGVNSLVDTIGVRPPTGTTFREILVSTWNLSSWRVILVN